MTTPTPDWPLAYGFTPVTWDGTIMGLRPDQELRDELAVHRDAGLSYVHLASFHFEEPTDFEVSEAVKRIADLLAEHDLRPASHHCMVPTFAKPGDDQGDVQQRLVDTCAMLAPLGPTALVVHPGRSWGRHTTMQSITDSYLAMEKEAGLEALIDTSADNLRAMARAAAEHDQTLALENLGRWEPLADQVILPQLVDRIGEPNAGYCFDSGHAHAFGEAQQPWLELIGDKLFATHFHDNHARGVDLYPPTGFVLNNKQVDEHLPVGFGTIPWLEVIRQLIANGYDGVVSFETSGWPIDDPVESLVQAQAWWRAAVQLASR